MSITFNWQIAGAFAFGLVLGWNVYFVNRYRKGDISFGDIMTLVGVVGGAAVLALFPTNTDLFGAYGVGLGVGFFAYFLSLLAMVRNSPNFDSDWFLDGRRRNPADGYGYGNDSRPTLAPMAVQPAPIASAPSVNISFHGTNPGDAATISVGAPPSLLSAPNPNAVKIQQTCADTWSESGPNGPFKSACNWYLIEVANRLSIGLSGTADQIIDNIKSSASWTPLSDGPAARDAAARGKIVVAGVKSDAYSPPRTEGHVAVVTAGPMNPGGWAPAGYWGSTDPNIAALGGSGVPISNCFTAAVKDKIIYRCRDI
jgi:hypothetical protein